MIKRYGSSCIIANYPVSYAPSPEEVERGFRKFISSIADVVTDMYPEDIEAIVPAYYSKGQLTFAFFDARRPVITFGGDWVDVAQFVYAFRQSCRVGLVDQTAVVQFNISDLLDRGRREQFNALIDHIQENFEDWTDPPPEVMISGILLRKEDKHDE